MMLSTRYHVDTVTLMLGTVVNQDQALGIGFTTPRLEGVSADYDIDAFVLTINVVLRGALPLNYG
jgi:hypothetical protein